MQISDEITIQKVRHHAGNGTTSIVFDAHGEQRGTYTFETAQDPHPDFSKAFQGLAVGIIEVAELKKVAKPDDIDVRGITWHHKDDQVGITFSGMRSLERSPAGMLINTPHKLLVSSAEDPDPDTMLSDEVQEAIEALRVEAVLFLRGKKAQVEMFDDPDQPAEGDTTEGEEWDEGAEAWRDSEANAEAETVPPAEEDEILPF